MGRHQRDKGKRGEREARDVLNELLPVLCRRGVQFQGGPDSPDVVGVPGIHLEVKRTERLRLYPSLEQAQQDSHKDDVPLLIHRSNRKPWICVFYLQDLLPLYHQLQKLFTEESNGT